jgi:hypothetical protein
MKLKARRRARCVSSRSNLNNRSLSAPASCRRSRRKTLPRTALDEIPMYRTGNFLSNRARSGDPEVERGITRQETSGSRSSRTFGPEPDDQNSALLRLDNSVGELINNSISRTIRSRLIFHSMLQAEAATRLVLSALMTLRKASSYGFFPASTNTIRHV